MINELKICNISTDIIEIIRQYEPYHIKSSGIKILSDTVKSINPFDKLKKYYGKADKNSFYASYFKYINEFEDLINQNSGVKFKDEPTLFICPERLKLTADKVKIRLKNTDIRLIEKTIYTGLTNFYGKINHIDIEPAYFLKKDLVWLGVLTRSLSAAAAYFAFENNSSREIFDAFIAANPYFEDKCYRYWLDFKPDDLEVFISLLKNTKGCLTDTFDIYKNNTVRDFLSNAVSSKEFCAFFKKKGKRFWRSETEYDINSFILYPKILWEFIAVSIMTKIGGSNE